jgi:hypothetical protein
MIIVIVLINVNESLGIAEVRVPILRCEGAYAPSHLKIGETTPPTLGDPH